MGGFGNPKYLCDECASDLDTITSSKDITEIETAMDKVSRKLSLSNQDDQLTIDTIKDIFSESGERAKKIKEGTYDFSEDEAVEEGMLEVPDELCETEEDRALDEKEANAGKLLDKIFNWIYLAIFVGVIAWFILYLVL